MKCEQKMYMKKYAIINVIALLLLLNSAFEAQSALSLPIVFSDHMVLQCDAPVPIWGKAEAGEEVNVVFAEQNRSTVADIEGNWQLTLDAMPANKSPNQLIIKGEGGNTIHLDDVLVGEVWVCAGQSNMLFSLNKSDGGEQEATKADYPLIRLLKMETAAYPSKRTFSEDELELCVPERYFTGQWSQCIPETAAAFSAVAFYFGKKLADELEVPIGLICNTIGSTPTEPWVSYRSLNSHQATRELLNNWWDSPLVKASKVSRFKENMGIPLNTPIPEDWPYGHPFKPTFLYEAGINTLAPYSMRGVIWYQGESNAPIKDEPFNPAYYTNLFRTLVEDWRQTWKQGDFPFLYVQLPSAGRNWMEFREVQRQSLCIQNTGMAVSIDVGDPDNIHPTNKKPIGERLALWALANTYGEDITYSSPLPRIANCKDGVVYVEFNHAEGLTTIDKKSVRGFEVADAKGNYHHVKAKIKEDTILINVSRIKQPTMIRYAWEPAPDVNLVNQAALPASPFLIKIECGISK